MELRMSVIHERMKELLTNELFHKKELAAIKQELIVITEIYIKECKIEQQLRGKPNE